MNKLSDEELRSLTEVERKEVYIEWLLNRGVAAATNKPVARLIAQMILDRLAALWELDTIARETWESEAALRMMQFTQGMEQ